MLTPRSFIATQAKGKLETVPGHAHDITRGVFVDDQRLGDSCHMIQEVLGIQHGKLPAATHVDLALDTLQLLVTMRP